MHIAVAVHAFITQHTAAHIIIHHAWVRRRNSDKSIVYVHFSLQWEERPHQGKAVQVVRSIIQSPVVRATVPVGPPCEPSR